MQQHLLRIILYIHMIHTSSSMYASNVGCTIVNVDCDDVVCCSDWVVTSVLTIFCSLSDDDDDDDIESADIDDTTDVAAEGDDTIDDDDEHGAESKT